MQNTKKIPEPIRCEPAKYEYKKSCYAEIYRVLQSFRKDEIYCDFQLETNDGKIINGHKVVLASASPYFHAMFTNCDEKNQYLVIMKQLDSTALQLLVNFIYTGEITVTENNLHVLLPASNLLQLQEVKEACCDFLQAQMCPKNCIGINALADLHSCKKLLTSSELYIQQHFLDVAEGNEFLYLSTGQMVKLIASDGVKVPSEEKIFESVIRWVKHDLGSRKCILPQLMEHVRLPLTSKDYILKKVVEEPLLDDCKDYVIEALHFHLLESDKLITIPHNIRTKARQPGGIDKVIFVVGGEGHNVISSTEWYDPNINQWHFGPKLITPRSGGGLAVVKDNFVLYLGGIINSRSVDVLDLSSESPSWEPTVEMLVNRFNLGVGVINNYVYAVGGDDGNSYSNSVEMFDCKTQEWSIVTNMSTGRIGAGIGVLNDILYVVGGYYSGQMLNSVESYHPTLDKWISVPEMCLSRCDLGVGVLNGLLYAVGGHDGLQVLRSVETFQPNTGVWSTIPDMHLCRQYPGVAVLDGLLYAVGGDDGTSALDSVEFYNPNNNTWTMVTAPMNVARTCLGVVAIDRPLHFKA
ncbi:kelch-like protein 2 isoform X2 [Metopolophium dirhodum]|uniref:kelch-like protein 2 isoform X2 n=1 Tax=Metopolophium dirhodum TaxID=44670 RepID=UPI00299001A6|nr:kelch-like protein 2 isoform X2 [Metopolophium dirhodum]